MKDENKNSDGVVSVDEAQSNQVVTIENETEPQPERSKKSHASSQTQLLSLAKTFKLDGGLRPPERQAPIEDRCQSRERFNHLRKQSNIESIITKSLAYCSAHQAADRADPDWFSSFVELAENVGNNTMQELWAKILAREVSHPGSFSLKAIKAFRNLSLSDAKLFGKACQLAVKDSTKKNIRILSGCYQRPGLFNLLDKKREQRIALSQFGFSYTEVLTLAENHLLFAQETELAPLQTGEELALKYNGQPLVLTAIKNQSVIQFYKFTPVGAELAQLIGDKPDDSFLAVLKTQLSHHFNCH